MSLSKIFNQQNIKLYQWLTVILTVILVADAVVNAQHNGDFIGYLNAGNRTLSGEDIYRDYLNTWPPFFSAFSVILALIDKVSPYLVRVTWLLGSVVSLFVCIKWMVKLITNKDLRLPFQKVSDNSQMAFYHPVIVIPLIIMLRLLLENSSHLQINLYMLFMAIGSVYYFHQSKYQWAGFLLGLSISLKVFTLIILLYFVYKRAFKIVRYTLFTMVGCYLVTVFVFGFEISWYYHRVWLDTQVSVLPPTHLTNQSLLAFLTRLLTYDGSSGYLFNIANMADEVVKKIFYVIVVFVAIAPAISFRKKLQEQPFTVQQLLEWSILFTVVPILSPVAWKYYYVFLWLPYFAFYLLVFSAYKLPYKNGKWIKAIFYISLLGTIFSSELFTGFAFSDVLESFGVVTWGAVFLLIAQFVLFYSLSNEILKHEFR